MKFTKLTSLNQFKNIKVGDYLLVEWSDNYVKHHMNCDNLMLYDVLEIKEKNKEIILMLPENHYFNYELYLNNHSCAKEIYLVEEGD